MNLNAVRGREDWWLGLIITGEEAWTVPLHRHSDYATFEFTMLAPFSIAEVHEEAVRQIAAWEAENADAT